MTTISAKIIKDSVSSEGIRLTTFLLRYPRCIHSELMTHRVFSRNASSSRAIPVTKLIQDVIDDPFIPIHWGKNQPGMQADQQCNNLVRLFSRSGGTSREQAWLKLRDQAVKGARAFAASDYHKQLVNRILEPFAHISVVVTSTHYANWFSLRDHPDAEPHIAILAQRMKEAYDASIPRLLGFAEYHLPFVEDNEFSNYHMTNFAAEYPADLQRLNTAVKLSVARCARTSYRLHDGEWPSIEKDLKLHDDLVVSEPLHASPAEHQATPDSKDQDGNWKSPEFHGNLLGWCQYRKMLPNEAAQDKIYQGPVLDVQGLTLMKQGWSTHDQHG